MRVLLLIENLERLLRITAESIGKRIDLICIDHINDIVDSAETNRDSL